MQMGFFIIEDILHMYRLIKIGSLETKLATPDTIPPSGWALISDDIEIDNAVALDADPYIREKNTEELLAEIKAAKIAELKQEGLLRIKAVHPSINNFDMLNLIEDLILTIAPSARQMQPDLTTILQIRVAGKNAVIEINALLDEASVNAYDVINTPAWP